jgi:hypothetical protein
MYREHRPPAGRPGSLDRRHSAEAPYPVRAGCRCTLVLDRWLTELESLEAISQDADTRRIFLRMAALSHRGRLPNFIAEVARDEELDDTTKGHLTELAQDEWFLMAVEEYLHLTRRWH